MLKSIALRVPRIRALVEHRNSLMAERDALLAERDALLAKCNGLLAEKEREQQACDRRVEELRTGNSQLVDALAHANVAPIPPAHLQARVVGDYYADFIRSGVRALTDFERALKPLGRTLDSFERVLDFGCGCGRVIRRFHDLHPKPLLTGADIDAEAIGWLQPNYASVGSFVLLPHLPPSELGSSQFDLIYAISVFTHLDEAMQFAWLAELQRVAKPGGLLLISVHGRHHHQRAAPEVQARIASGFYFDGRVGTTAGLPDFYRDAFHTREYVEGEWSRFFEIISYEETGQESHQDLILCRKR